MPCEGGVCHLLNWSPDLRETFVSCLGHSTLIQHVVTYFAEDLKLFLTGESIRIITFFHDADHVCFVGDHQSRREMS